MSEKDLIEFVEAIAAAFPEGAERDRFGRYVEGFQVEREALRKLAVKYKLGGGYDTQDQAGRVARAILDKENNGAPEQNTKSKS